MITFVHKTIALESKQDETLNKIIRYVSTEWPRKTELPDDVKCYNANKIIMISCSCSTRFWFAVGPRKSTLRPSYTISYFVLPAKTKVTKVLLSRCRAHFPAQGLLLTYFPTLSEKYIYFSLPFTSTLQQTSGADIGQTISCVTREKR